jgi:outer membrane protein OmpA-like peptidoglycan-associated protein/tetratricopeptide (TPR) repeat protein
MKNSITLFIALLFIQSTILATTDKAKFNATKNIKAAEKAMEVGDVYQAADLYDEVLQNDQKNKAVAYKLGMLYFGFRDYKNAERCFQMAIGENVTSSAPLAGYYYALMQKMNGKYPEAKKSFEAFKKSYKGEELAFNKKWIDVEIEGCVMAINKSNEIKNVVVKHPGAELNSPYADISPVLWDSSSILFASRPTDTIIVRNKDNYQLQFYKATVDNGNFSKAALFEKFNIKNKDIKNGCFSADKKRFYFNICGENKDYQNICEIYVSDFKNGNWQDPVKLPESVNMPKYTSLHPAIGITKDNKEILYFVSDRPEGKGGLDIWYATVSKAGDVGEARNAGSKINTDRNEVTPSFDFINKTLYFSSDGKKGFGGFDIYSTTGSTSVWSVPENVGYPINSSVNDQWFVAENASKKGYFVSNRSGIISIKSETCCPDIFTFEYVNVINIALRGKVFEKSDSGISKELSGAKISISLIDDESNENVGISEQSFEAGKPYFSNLKLEKKYKVTATKEGYLSSSITLNTLNITKTDTLLRDLYLSKIDKNKAYRLNNIYYDFDKSNLRDISTKTLDSLYFILTENPLIIIELGSHTDSRGSDEYNLDLSQKRAQSCVDYLISKGIAKERISPKGYGESKPLQDCSKLPECPTTSAGDCDCHQLNRRTEFRIIGELDAKLYYEGQRIQENKE